jgi:hypothetical protein
VKLWDGRSGQEVVTLRGHTNVVWGVAFSPDGQRLASASQDRTVKLWNGYRAQEVLTLRAHTAWVHSVAYSPDGQRLASASADGTVKLWHGCTGELLSTLRGHTGPVWKVAFSPDGPMVFSQGDDRIIRAWDATTGAVFQVPLEVGGLLHSGGGPAARHPSRPLLALAVGHRIELVDMSPTDPLELAFRRAVARLDVPWQQEQATANKKSKAWFGAALHWGQLAAHEPGKGQYWQELQAACAKLGDWRPALVVCDRLLGEEPTLAAVFFRRARLRAHQFQFHEATGDNLAGLALLGRTKKQ